MLNPDDYELPFASFELKIFLNYDKELLSCIVCDLPSNIYEHNRQHKEKECPEYLVVLKSPIATYHKGLHEKCKQYTTQYNKRYDKLIMEKVLE